MIKPMRILTMDPSLRAWGWAKILEEGECGCFDESLTAEVIDQGVIKTQKPKNLPIIKGRLQSAKEIAERLVALIDDFWPCIVLAEDPTGSQHANDAASQGICQGIIAGICEARRIPYWTCSPLQARQALGLKPPTTKAHVVNTIGNLLPDLKWSGVKYVDEAVADALAVSVAWRRKDCI